MKKILLIEDDLFLADEYAVKLREAGFSVEVLSDGDAVLPKIKEKKPDLVLLDIILPHLDGWEVMRQIKETDELKDLKVVILSNLCQKNEIERGLKLGAVKYFIKTHYTSAEIVEEIKKILK